MGEHRMTRQLTWSVPLIVLLAATFAPATMASPIKGSGVLESDVALPAGFEAVFFSNQFPGGKGSALSAIHLPLGPGGTISTQFKGRPPGEIWGLELYDRGTCAAVKHVVMTLPSVRIGSTGGRTGKVILTAAMRRAIITTFSAPRALVIRLSNGSYSTCHRFFPIH
jgi:hypothetical protein